MKKIFASLSLLFFSAATSSAFADTKIALITIAPRDVIVDSTNLDFYTLQGTSAILVESSGKDPAVYAYLPSSHSQHREMFRLPLRGLRRVLDKGNPDKQVDGHFQKFSVEAFKKIYKKYDFSKISEVSTLSLNSKQAEQVSGELEKRSSKNEPVTAYSIFLHNSSVALSETLFSVLGKQIVDELNRKGLGDNPALNTRRAILKKAVQQALNQYKPLRLLNERPTFAIGYSDLLRGTNQEFRTNKELVLFLEQVIANIDALAKSNPKWYQGLCERAHARSDDKELFETELLTSQSLITANRLREALIRVNVLQSTNQKATP